MSRLTKVKSIHNNEPESYEANIELYPDLMGYEHQAAEMDCIDKLGQIEDLMEEYEINSIEELENIIAYKVIAGGSRSGGKSIVQKGMLYNKLSEELGCPSVVVFRALISGIIVRNHEDLIEIGYSDREDKYVYFSTEEIYLKNWQSHGIEKTTNSFQITYGDDGEWCVYLKDYGKTWWLKGEK